MDFPFELSPAGSFDLSCLDDMFMDPVPEAAPAPQEDIKAVAARVAAEVVRTMAEQQQEVPTTLSHDDEAIVVRAAAEAVLAADASAITASPATTSPATAPTIAPTIAPTSPATASTSYVPLSDIIFSLSQQVAAGGADAAPLSELLGLLADWNDGKLSQKNKSFSTPYEIVSWVAEHPTLTPPDLFWHINQIYYNNSKSDDKHFYMASMLKKMLNMVSLEYGIPIADLYTKFGTKEVYQCAAVVGGKRRCEKVANGGFFCGNHSCQRCDPATDFKRWKGMA